MLVSSGQDCTLQVWKYSDFVLEEPKATMGLGGQEQTYCDLSIHPQGHIMASACSDRTVVVWDMVRGEPAYSCMGHGGAVTVVAFNTNGSKIVSGDSDGKLIYWDVAESQATLSGVIKAELDDPDLKGFTACEFHPDGQGFVVTTVDGFYVVDQCRVAPPPTVASFMRLSPQEEAKKKKKEDAKRKKRR